jgi:hypothetical protein
MRISLGILAGLVGYFIWVTSFAHLTDGLLAALSF